MRRRKLLPREYTVSWQRGIYTLAPPNRMRRIIRCSVVSLLALLIVGVITSWLVAGWLVFIISGTEDRHTTATETKVMFSVALQPKELMLVDGAAHVDLYRVSPVEYRTRVLRFLDQHMRMQPEDSR